MHSDRKPLVIDTSTLIGIWTSQKLGFPAQALNIAFLWYQLVVSDETLAELKTVIGRDFLDKYHPRAARLAFVQKLEMQAFMVDITVEVRDCRDPNDDKFLSLALSAGAKTIVSSDPDLYLMHPYRDISIIRPRPFVEAHSHLPMFHPV